MDNVVNGVNTGIIYSTLLVLSEVDSFLQNYNPAHFHASCPTNNSMIR